MGAEKTTWLHLLVKAGDHELVAESVELLVARGEPNGRRTTCPNALDLLAVRDMDGARPIDLGALDVNPYMASTLAQAMRDWRDPFVCAAGDQPGMLGQALQAHPEALKQRTLGGLTVLHWAAMMWDSRIAREALRAGADLEATDDRGRTPLMFAILGASLGAVGILLRAGARVNVQDAQGKTALHYAVGEMRREHDGAYVSLLVGAGADLNVKDQDGRAPVEINAELADFAVPGDEAGPPMPDEEQTEAEPAAQTAA